MKERKTRTRVLCLLATAIFVSSATVPLASQGSDSVLKINDVKHDLRSIDGSGQSVAPSQKDIVTISGDAEPGAEISVIKSWYGTVIESKTTADGDGYFTAIVEFDVGPGFAEDVKSGLVTITLRSGTSQSDVMLIQSDIPARQVFGASPQSGSWGKTYATDLINQGFPHNFVVQHNDWLWYTVGSESGLADALAKFDIVTLHYVDTSQHVAAIKERNPNVKVFAYFNPLLVYRSSSPSSEWQQVVQYHPDWWLNGMTDYGGTQQVMDITKQGWNDRCVALCKAALAKGFDGLYVDNGIQYPRDTNPAYGYTASDANWLPAMNYFLERVHFNGFPVFYNGQSPMMNAALSSYMDSADGWMDEGYISYKGWQLSTLDMPYYASQRGKLTMFYAVSGDRYFYFLSSLLSDGYFYYAPTDIQWFSEYGSKLGRATGDAYYKDRIWQRDFENGKVLVNPSSGAVQVNTPGYSSGSSSSHSIDPYSGVILTRTGAGKATITAAGLYPGDHRYFAWKVTNIGDVGDWVYPMGIAHDSKDSVVARVYAYYSTYIYNGQYTGWIYLNPGESRVVYTRVVDTSKWDTVYTNVYSYLSKNYVDSWKPFKVANA